MQREVRMDPLRVTLSVVSPPVGVFLVTGFSGHFRLNVLLTLAGYVPGLLHGIWVCARHSRASDSSPRHDVLI